MEKLDEEWVEELRRLKERHIEFVPLQMRLMELEAQYHAVLNSLAPEQREVIEEFVWINQKMEIWLTNQAYLSGIQVGERRKK